MNIYDFIQASVLPSGYPTTNFQECI